MGANFMLVLSGPSGAGKSTLVRRILAEYSGFTYSVSATTRAPRPGEREGVDYFFVSEERFQAMIREDALLEWARVYDRFYYGTPRAFVEEQLRQGRDLVVDVDVQGGLQIMDRFPAAEFVFVRTRDIATLEARIRDRGTMNPAELTARLATARAELAQAGRYRHEIVNEDLEQAWAELQAVIRARKASAA
ncbi:MAG: guanylate kinase [Planctomycetota bacterium]